MTDPGTTSPEPPDAGPPDTGEPTIDRALGGLPELSDIPVTEHYDRLAQAHAVLDGVLGRDGADDA